MTFKTSFSKEKKKKKKHNKRKQRKPELLNDNVVELFSRFFLTRNNLERTILHFKNKTSRQSPQGRKKSHTLVLLLLSLSTLAILVVRLCKWPSTDDGIYIKER